MQESREELDITLRQKIEFKQKSYYENNGLLFHKFLPDGKRNRLVLHESSKLKVSIKIYQKGFLNGPFVRNIHKSKSLNKIAKAQVKYQQQLSILEIEIYYDLKIDQNTYLFLETGVTNKDTNIFGK